MGMYLFEVAVGFFMLTAGAGLVFLFLTSIGARK